MDQAGYKQFCPLAMAAEVICTRWTLVLMRELIAGSTRFNDLRRGVPKMSPSLLSKRLKELEDSGIVERRPVAREPGVWEYHLTPAGRDLRGVVESVGFWGQKWVESKLSLQNLDPSLLMWDMRRHLNPDPLPKRRVTVRFTFAEAPDHLRDHWMVVEPSGAVDLCHIDPGHEVDLFVTGSLRAMTAVWMGKAKLREVVEDGSLELIGDAAIARSMQSWLGLSPFAREQRAA